MSDQKPEQMPPFDGWWGEYETLEIHKQSLDLLNRDAIAKRIARDAWNEAWSRRAAAVAAAGIGQAEFVERLIAEVSELQISTSYSGHWINGYGHAREDVLRLIRKLESTAAEPWRIERVRQAESSAAPSPVKGEDEKCAGCGHSGPFDDGAFCIAPVMVMGNNRLTAEVPCGHRCDFSRPEPPESWYQDSTERMI